jgi:hypothetical protein
MSDSHDKLRDTLLSLEPVNPDFHARYKEEMEKMFNEEITGLKRFGWLTRDSLLMLLGLILIFGAILNKPFALPAAGRWLWVAAGLFNLVIAILGFRIIRKKNMDLRKDSKIIARVGFAGLFAISMGLMLVGFLGGNVMDLVTIAPMALLIMIMAILIGVDNRVQQSELNIREKLLEIEMQLAELKQDRVSKR